MSAMTMMALPASPMPEATPGLSAAERLQLAKDLLRNGEAERASVELKAYPAKAPDSKIAFFLLSQIETPIENLFPSDSFTVKVGKNQTLSSLAKTYLGNELSFYGLARFNQIRSPADVKEGDAISIPATPEALVAESKMAARTTTRARALPAKPMAVSPSETSSPPVVGTTSTLENVANPWEVIRKDLDAGRYDAAIRNVENSEFTPNRSQAFRASMTSRD
jgi:hypothetical protein